MKSIHRRNSILLTTLAAIAISSQFFCKPATSENNGAAVDTTSTKKALTGKDLVARGAYLVNTGSCTDCHSPKIMTAQGPMPDTTRFLSGHPAGSPLPAITYDATKPGNWMLFAPDLTASVGPWGMSFSANLTPDSTTGIGAWTAEVFKKTLRTGKHLGQDGGRSILPPMPWPTIGQMTDDDLDAIFAYLHSLPAIKNMVPAPIPPNEVFKK